MGDGEEVKTSTEVVSFANKAVEEAGMGADRRDEDEDGTNFSLLFGDFSFLFGLEEEDDDRGRLATSVGEGNFGMEAESGRSLGKGEADRRPLALRGD